MMECAIAVSRITHGQSVKRGTRCAPGGTTANQAHRILDCTDARSWAAVSKGGSTTRFTTSSGGQFGLATVNLVAVGHSGNGVARPQG
jgi:hypothetical protein